MLWAVALVAVVGTLATMSMATTAGAAAAESVGCCCPCGRGASVKWSADYVEMGDAGRTKPGPRTSTVDHETARTKPGPTLNTGGARKAVEATSFVRFFFQVSNRGEVGMAPRALARESVVGRSCQWVRVPPSGLDGVL